MQRAIRPVWVRRIPIGLPARETLVVM
jgi:hypothetical protein